ncbi:hypothetical protein [Geminisphaera colitermitum]|uniref:hypothetical protein n=1 Tax=Geminisphaera colitermitum TaxID=1148786 RepID=UPI0001964DC5|nr:hypothetical protein [Geminisphaera colitermitum]
MQAPEQVLAHVLDLLYSLREAPTGDRAALTRRIDESIRSLLDDNSDVSVREMREFIVHEKLPDFIRSHKKRHRPDVAK